MARLTRQGLFVGLATLDVIQLVDSPPGLNQKTAALRSWLAAGGPAAGAAITFAALGGQAQLWTVLGDSPSARLVAGELANCGVEIVDFAPAGFDLAASVVQVIEATGERSVVSGSAHRPDLAEVSPGGVGAAEIVLIDGHHPGLARPAVSSAAAAGLPVVVDAGSYKPVLAELLPRATEVICSADYRAPDDSSGAALLQGRTEFVAVSHGAEAVQWWSREQTGVVRPPAVPVRDTLGAGDVLHGAYCYWRCGGLAPIEALRRAVEVASERVQHLGPTEWRSAVAATGGPGN